MDKNKYGSDMKEEIKEICTELNDGKIAVVQATEKLLNLFSVSGSEYQEKLLKKADEMKEIGKLWHSNKVYTDGIDCALDNMKEHIKKIGENHYR